MTTSDAARARAQKKAEKAEEEARQLAEEEEYDNWITAAKDRSADLTSVVDALRNELDPLTKKWPTMSVSDLMLQRVNKVIKESHTLMDREENDFLQAITEFVAAGDNPESRDVQMVLAELKSLLTRFQTTHYRDWH